MSEEKTNLTGGQIATIMDTLLYDALGELMLRTDVFDVQLAYILALSTSNKKRKLCSAVERTESITMLVRAMTSTDRQVKLDIVSKLGLERQFVFVFLRKFLDRYYDNYMSVYRKFLISRDHDEHLRLSQKLDVMASAVGAESKSAMFLTLNLLNTALGHFMSFYNDVISDFLCFCRQQARFYVTTNTNHFDQDDVRQNFLHAVIRAVNKYDSAKGALTSYVKWWILNAQTCNSSEHEYGIAYTIPQTQRKRLAEGSVPHSVNFSVSLDSQSSGEDGEETSLHQKLDDSRVLEDSVNASRVAERLSLLVKKVDPHGIARLTFDLAETFTEEEQAQMRKHMRKHGLI